MVMVVEPFVPLFIAVVVVVVVVGERALPASIFLPYRRTSLSL